MRRSKRGVFVQKRHRLLKFTADELDRLPPLHEARKNPDLMVERAEIVQLDMPPFGKVTNRAGVVFNGEEPVMLGGWADAN